MERVHFQFSQYKMSSSSFYRSLSRTGWFSVQLEAGVAAALQQNLSPPTLDIGSDCDPDMTFLKPEVSAGKNIDHLPGFLFVWILNKSGRTTRWFRGLALSPRSEMILGSAWIRRLAADKTHLPELANLKMNCYYSPKS